MPVKAFFERLRRFAELDEINADLVGSIPWSSVSVGRRHDILKVGATPDYVYIIESGWAARYGIRTDGTRRITGFMLPGDFCGIHAVTGRPMEHAITALTDCEVLRVQREVMENTVAVSPALGKALWRAKLIDEAILRVWLLNSQDSAQALAHLLCELHARARQIGSVRDGRFQLPLTQEHIADALGITPVHTNRMMKQLRLEGLIEYERYEVIIPDIAALEKVCGFSSSYLHFPERIEIAA